MGSIGSKFSENRRMIERIKTMNNLDDKLKTITRDKKRMKIFLIWILSQKTNRNIMRMILSYLLVPSDNFQMLSYKILTWHMNVGSNNYYVTKLNKKYKNCIVFFGMDKQGFVTSLRRYLNEYDFNLLNYHSIIDDGQGVWFKIMNLPVLLICLKY